MDGTELRKLLSSYQPEDDTEAISKDRMLHLLESGEEAWNRAHYNPGHFTASTYVVDPISGTLAMVFHGKLKRWLQPGGHVEASDPSILSSAQRELAEETGLNPLGQWRLIDLDIHTIPARKNQPQHEHFDCRFLCVLKPGESRALRAADDAEQADWKPLGYLAQSEEVGMVRVFHKIESLAIGLDIR
jgi:8-oxo-dGTP pyrophosphatase MutT (NUDIX family)